MSSQVNVQISLGLESFLRQSRQSSGLQRIFSVAPTRPPTATEPQSTREALDLVRLKQPRAQPLIGLVRGWKEEHWTGGG